MNAIAEAFIGACRDEIEAPKPGNVHIFAEGHGMTAADFLASADAAAPGLCASGSSIGDRILTAIEATFAAVGQNTNLGIVLLCAPLAAAAEIGADLRHGLRKVLAEATRADAAKAFRAIVIARPAGLGAAPRHDVRTEAETTLLEAMRAAADRDRIAFQYVSAFEDVFVTGLEALEAARSKALPAPWPAVAVHLAFLAHFPDSHIFRKWGAEKAALVRDEAQELHRAFVEQVDPASMLDRLLSFDRDLKAQGLNPGTTADLTVATLFADRLTRILIARRNDD